MIDAVRSTYRELTPEDKDRIASVKAAGQAFIDALEATRTPMKLISQDDGSPMSIGYFDRELNIAIERSEEAVMWAVKHLTLSKD